MIDITINNIDPELWDHYVTHHVQASLYHLNAFRSVVEKTYNHKSYYLSAQQNSRLIGVLPLFHIKSLFLGNALVSLPFCDYGGILADSDETVSALYRKAIELSMDTGCAYCELRQTYRLPLFEQSPPEKAPAVSTEKVRMSLFLPASEDELFSSFPAKLRSQIRKPQKEGCSVKIGGIELLDDFYSVFAYNMRDLGSPVHPKKMIRNMLDAFGAKSRLFVVYLDFIPVACSLAAGFGDSYINPWASFNRTYGKIAPNMLLYWEMLRFAVAEGYRHFDFGRSTANEGTYKFKSQWGALPQQLYWYRTDKEKKRKSAGIDKGTKSSFVRIWRALPLPVTQICGPLLRRHLHM